MVESNPSGPVLFCFDGSEGSRNALRAAGELINRPVDAVVLTVWETVETRLALVGGFAANFPFDGADMDGRGSLGQVSGGRGGSPGHCARLQGRADGQASAHGDSYDHPGGSGRDLGPTGRVRPARARRLADRAAGQRLPPARLARPAPGPHNPAPSIRQSAHTVIRSRATFHGLRAPITEID